MAGRESGEVEKESTRTSEMSEKNSNMPRNSGGRAWNASEPLDCASVAYFSRTSDIAPASFFFITASAARISAFFGLREVHHVRPQRTLFIYIRNSFYYFLFIYYDWMRDIHLFHLHTMLVSCLADPPTCVKLNDIVAGHLYKSCRNLKVRSTSWKISVNITPIIDIIHI